MHQMVDVNNNLNKIEINLLKLGSFRIKQTC